MPYLSLLALPVVLAAATFLVSLFVASVVVPDGAARFLGGFASSARAHYTELVLRLVAGTGFVVYAPFMAHSTVFRGFGWLLLLTTTIMLLLPWRWHHRFAGWAVPFAQRNLRLYAGCGFLLGAFIVYAIVAGDPPVPAQVR